MKKVATFVLLLLPLTFLMAAATQQDSANANEPAGDVKAVASDKGAESDPKNKEEKDPGTKDLETRWRDFDSDGCLVDEESVRDLKKARDELRQQKKDIEVKTTELAARERAIQEELKKIEEMQTQLANRHVQVKKENEEKVAKIVETVESMSPKAAAVLVAGLDEGLAVAAMTQLSTAKLAKIMNLMEPSRSTRLAESLAGYSKNPTKKGGE